MIDPKPTATPMIIPAIVPVDNPSFDVLEDATTDALVTDSVLVTEGTFMFCVVKDELVDTVKNEATEGSDVSDMELVRLAALTSMSVMIEVSTGVEGVVWVSRGGRVSSLAWLFKNAVK